MTLERYKRAIKCTNVSSFWFDTCTINLGMVHCIYGVAKSQIIYFLKIESYSFLNSVQKLCGTGFSQFLLIFVILGPTSL